MRFYHDIEQIVFLPSVALNEHMDMKNKTIMICFWRWRWIWDVKKKTSKKSYRQSMARADNELKDKNAK